MSATSRITPGFEEIIVITIQQHKHLGAILVPALVHKSKNGDLGFFFQRLYLHTIPEHLKPLNEEETKMFRLLDECADKHLCTSFSKKARNPDAFFTEIEEVRLKSLVIPYVQSRVAKSLEILSSAGIQLHYKGGKNADVRPRPVTIMPHNARAVFHFEKEENGSRYRMYLRHGNDEEAGNWEKISLKEKPALVLVNKPGWVLVGDRIYKLEEGVDGVKVKPFFTKDFISIPQTAEEQYFRKFVARAIKNHEVHLSGIEMQVEKPDPVPVLKLENDWMGEPALLLEFNYDDKQCKHADPDACWVDVEKKASQYVFTKTLRNKASEQDFIGFLLTKKLNSKDNSIFKAFKSTGGKITRAHDMTVASTDIETDEHLPAHLSNQDATGDMMLNLTIDWVAKNHHALTEKGFQVEQHLHKQKYFLGSISLEMKFSARTDWFDVLAHAVFGEYRIPFYKLRNHLLNGNRRFLLPGGELAILPEEWFARYDALLMHGKGEEDTIRLRKHHFPIVKELAKQEFDDEKDREQASIGKSIKHRADKLSSLLEKDNIPLPEVPRELKNTIRPYQAAGFAWMHLLGQQKLGGCLADDMGLGKTLQCLTLLWKQKLEHKPQPQQPSMASNKGVQLDLFSNAGDPAPSSGRTSLIVMPLSLMHNWENEIRKFTPKLSHIRYYGQHRHTCAETLMEHDIVLTTYGMVRNDLEFLGSLPFFYVILDESQLIKNPASKVSRAVRRLQAENRLVLTGTPIENSLTDLWTQLSFLNPGLLGSLKFFQEHYAAPVEKAGMEKKQEELKKLVEPYILRRTKALVEKDLPELTEHVHYCEMPDAQKRLYESKKSEIRNHILAKASKEERSGLRFDILRGLMQLRLIANHPDLTGSADDALPSEGEALERTKDENRAETSGKYNDPQEALQSVDGENGEEISGKFNEVIRIIEDLRAEGHKLLIFSQFVKHLQLFRKHFEAQEWKHAYLTGAQNATERQQLIADFRKDRENMLFLISLKAGGVGLNLTEADYVLLLDPWWNPAVEQQAISRAHRIGQQNPVIAYKFITSGTVEEKILKLQQQKSQLAGNLIDSDDPFRMFSEEEMLGLLE